MSVSRLTHIPGVGVDSVGSRADRAADPSMLRLEKLETDLRPPHAALVATRQAVDRTDANTYLPSGGSLRLREAVVEHVRRTHAVQYDPVTECVITAGGLNGVLNVLLATVEPGQEVVLPDPIYAGLVNRVRLAGGVPRFVASEPTPSGWAMDPAALAAAVNDRTAVVLLMSPVMPTGAVLDNDHWEALAGAVAATNAWVLYDAAMERLRFDGHPPTSPLSNPVLRERTITVGAASKELRMIGWRIGWVLGPAPIIRDVSLVAISNVACPVGIAQEAVAAALAAEDAERDMADTVLTLRERAECVVDQLAGYHAVMPCGGWSLLVNTLAFGWAPAEAAERLFTEGRVAATPMAGWGPSGDGYLRLVFANEPLERLHDLKARFDAAFA